MLKLKKNKKLIWTLTVGTHFSEPSLTAV
jgi:hypothetical protein